ncbi:imidazole glycerol phosphate synthase subunit HisH [bacterium]|nr:imidazole glycerol phosphate synthase subunit HisH [bacterium]
MGNLKSVSKAIEHVGHRAVITSEPTTILSADRLILPGVGAFRDAIARLKELGLDDTLRDYHAKGRPMLGICLGLQLLFDRSEEEGLYEGLGILAGDVVRFESRASQVPGQTLKVPHMGWNELEIVRPAPILEDLGPKPSVYFVHSYYVRPKDTSVIATVTDYGIKFTSMIWKEHLFASQFHPEKSQQVGLSMLAKFAEV